MTAVGPLGVLREIERALDRYGLPPRRLDLVSPLGEKKGVRLAYLAEAYDGRRVKARHFGTAEDARRHFALRDGLDAAFAPTIARFDSVVIEEWVEGTPLDTMEERRRIEEAGALLGRLHARPLGSQAAISVSTGKWIARSESDLQILVGCGSLATDEAARLRRELRRHDPHTARVAVIHLDFCVENMLIDRAGHLRVIDNELLSIDPAGLDLGRTFHRWPMPSEAWVRFIRGYRSEASALEPDSGGFWKISAALTGARVFCELSPERLPGSIELLRRFAAGELLQDPAS